MCTLSTTWSDLEENIRKQSVKNAAFRAEFLADPKAVIEKYSGEPMGDVSVYVHEQTSDAIHFVLPPDPATMDDELSDEDLEKVAGGEFVIGLAVIATIAASVGAGVSTANDQTQRRHGW